MAATDKKETQKFLQSFQDLLVFYYFFYLLLGGVVGAIEISCTYPTEYLKTVMQLDRTKYKLGMINLGKETYK